MIATLTSFSNRVFAVLGRLSMYRVVFLALVGLSAVALVVSVFGLVAPGPLELLATLAVLLLVSAATDAIAHRVLRLPLRLESALITSFILLFVLRPTLDPAALAGIALAGVVASASKYLLAWRGRHIFNPGLAVLWRTEKVRVVALFLVVAVGVGVLRTAVQYQQAGITVAGAEIVGPVIWASPFLFLGAFMLSEPLTLPPRRWQQLSVAALVGVLAGWPIDLGAVSLGQERALLIGNLLAFAFTFRTAVRLTLIGRRHLTPTVQELSFRAKRPLRFDPGQFLELDVPHHRPDARGTRREFSIVSAPADAPEVRVAFRDAVTAGKAQSSYKKALAEVTEGSSLAVTGVWGDFLLPSSTTSPVLMVAAGIGVTPFVSQLRQGRLTDQDRDVVLVYVAAEASELVFRDEIEASGVPVIVFTRDEPDQLPSHWRWARGVRLDADGLLRVVPDIAMRHAYISGPPRLIADLAPALDKARSITTDAFSGY